MTSLAFMNPNRHFVGPNFEECLTAFADAAEMAICTGISPSSINHILKGRPVHYKTTRKRYEAQCGAYLEISTKPATPHIETPPTPHIETPPTQQALDLDPQVFVVSVPAANADKLQKVLSMFGAEMVEVD